MGFSHVWNVDVRQVVKIKEKDSIIITIGRPEYIKKYNKNNIYIAVSGSDIPNQTELYKNRILNVSLEKWDYTPIETRERLPQIIDDMELFASMNENKEKILL